MFSLALLVALPLGSRAESTSEAGAVDFFHSGSKQLGFLAGYGIGFRSGSGSSREGIEELGDVGIVNLISRFGIGLTDPLGSPDSWIRGNIELLVQLDVLLNTRPHFGRGIGAGISLRYNFLRGERIVPYLDANLGLLGLDFDLAGQADGFNFNVGLGLGAHWFVRSRLAIDTEVRWQHISNANTRRPNHGINDALILVGMSYFFD